MAGGGARSRAISISRIAPDDVDEVTRFITQQWQAAHDERLRLLHRPAPASETGWMARGSDGAVIGAIVEHPESLADVPLGNWVGAPGVSALLYREAAAAWVLSSKLTHRVTLAAGGANGAGLLDLGFGHQQAYGVAAVGALSRVSKAGELRELTASDADELAEIVPLVSRHQSESPVFGPRLDGYYQQLPSSIGDFLENPATVAWGYSAAAGSALDGFLLAQRHSGVVEITLMGSRPEARNRGVGSALLGAVAAFSGERGIGSLLTDWRTTNLESSQFWRAKGFTPVAYRWCRVIDPTPE